MFLLDVQLHLHQVEEDDLVTAGHQALVVHLGPLLDVLVVRPVEPLVLLQCEAVVLRVQLHVALQNGLLADFAHTPDKQHQHQQNVADLTQCY